MKMTNREIVDSLNGLNLLYQEEKSDKPLFRVGVAHKINRNRKKLTEAYLPYDEDRKKLLRQKMLH